MNRYDYLAVGVVLLTVGVMWVAAGIVRLVVVAYGKVHDGTNQE